MKAYIKGISFVLVVVSLLGCSRKRNTFVSRNWHALTAEYNTLYNGDLALEQGKQELNNAYFDNFWDLLPVERMELQDEVVMPGESGNSSFQIAEEKATKAIQKHSMLINGREKNPKIDEAYLLLGKSRYFDQRFVPAMEAFNFILHKYPLSNTITQAKIWREKTNIRLEFEELAIKNLKEILDKENIEDQDRADASAMLAQAYINLTYRDSAVAPIEQAARYTRNSEEKGRYLFIKGQLYNLLEQRDSANLAFDEVIDMNRKIPRNYLINAQLFKIRNLAVEPENEERILERLQSLEEDRENRDFLDKIYFEMAEFHDRRDSIPLAVKFYNRSLRAPSHDLYLRSLNYQRLGNIYFEEAEYVLAGAYYDSTLTQLPENSREYRSVNRKRENLEDVIYYESVAQANDSILYLTSLPEEEQMAFFTGYTQKLKEEAASANTNESPAQPNAGNIVRPTLRPPGVPNPGSSFYFYNSSAVSHGKEEFLRTWGNRPLSDNWRTGEGLRNLGEEITEPVDQELVLETNPLFDPYTYMESLPDDREVLDSLATERNFAYYQLGLIYLNQFEEPLFAAEKLETLLASNPEERLKLPAKYHLFTIYEETGATVKALSMKNDILHEYPDSRYAAIIQNPEEVMEVLNDPENQYNALYEQFEDQEYEAVIIGAERMAEEYMGDPIVPKFRLLKAMAIGRLRGLEAYREALNEVALDYPQTEEGKKAERMVSDALPSLSNGEFREENFEEPHKLIYSFQRAEEEEVVKFQEELVEAIDEIGYTGLKVSKDVYDSEKVFVVVHGFSSLGRARYFAEKLSIEKEVPIHEKYFYITSPNYRIAQIHKTIETYLSTKSPQ